MKKNIIFLLTIILCSLPFCSIKAAIAITPPDHFVGDGTLNSGTPSLIDVKIIDEYPGTYYLKAYFYPPDNVIARFGYVWNSATSKWISAWQVNSEQLQIEVAKNQTWNGVPVKGLWQGEISVKTDIEKSGYLGPGDYTLKVRAFSISTNHVIEITTKTSIIKSGAESQASPQTPKEGPTIPTSNTQNPTPIIPASIESIADKVEINTASLEQLDEITGIGPVLAQRITDARPFSSVDDLLRVKGIGEKTLQKIKDQGLAYIEGQTQQPGQQTNQTQNPQVQNIDTVNLTPNTQNPRPTPINYPSGIVFNEIMPSPDGPDTDNEYIKIFNQNDFEVDLSGWQIKDEEGKVTIYTINAKIPASAYLVLKRPETKITLNNDRDSLELLNPDGEIVDSVSFEKAFQGQPYSKSSSGWIWSGGSTTVKSNKSGDEAEVDHRLAEKQTANIGNIDLSNQNPNPPILLIALIISVFSVIIALKLFRDRQNLILKVK